MKLCEGCLYQLALAGQILDMHDSQLALIVKFYYSEILL